MSESYSVADHFKDKDKGLRKTYDALLASIREFGPVTPEAHKTSIHLVNHSALAGVRVRKTYILLNFKSDHPIESNRIQKSERLSAKRFHHELKIITLADLDTELRGWLHEAYALSA